MALPAVVEPYAIATIVNIILALGLYVTLSSGQLSIAHSGLMGLGAYSSAILTTTLGWPFLAALITGVVVASAIGAGLGFAVRNMSELTGSLATLAFGQTLAIVGYNAAFVGGAQGFSGVPLDTTLPVAVAALCVAVYVVWRYDASRLSLAARAVRTSRAAAGASGVDPARIRVFTFALGGALAGLAGVIYVHYVLFISPDDLGFFPSFTILVFVFFGGSEVLIGPIAGATVLTVLPFVLGFATAFRFALYGLLIAAVVLIRPQGLFTRGASSPLELGRRARHRFRRVDIANDDG